MAEERVGDQRLPSVFYNWVSLAGAVLAVVSLSVIVLLILIDQFVGETTLYLGLVTFMLLPAFLVVGLILIAVGALMERHRQAIGIKSAIPTEIFIDLYNPKHRNAVLIWCVGTSIFLLGSSVGTYKLYKETESVEFCGTLCHSVMHPEYTAYQTSPHARVGCAECHIGPGADWFVKSKLSGAYQVYATLAHVYPKPVPTPIKNLRPARETCEHCHWPEKFFEARKDVNPHFLSDEENTPYPIAMLINIGGHSERSGRAEGIHWHVAGVNQMEYIARDESRQEIAWVRMVDSEGNRVVYNSPGNPVSEAETATSDIRKMDCIDCHNRPSHNYRSPAKLVNLAMAQGEIDRTLPYVKREAVRAMDQEYDSTPAAVAGMRAHIFDFYKAEYPDVVKGRADDLEATVTALEKAYKDNVFPEMKVNWRQYPDNIGHSEFIGCFRCHGSELETDDGKTIRNDCDMCHTIVSQGPSTEPTATPAGGFVFAHPVDIDGAETEGACTECHEGGAELY
jgi:hypothetical protein